MNQRAQAELAAVLVFSLAALWLYRSYLERALILQEEHQDAVRAQNEREYLASDAATVERLAADLMELRDWTTRTTGFNSHRNAPIVAPDA